MDFNLIVERFNYDNDFSEFLREIYLELVKYYGNEQLIFSALYNTNIVSVNNVYDFLKDANMLEEYDAMVTADDLKKSAGVYHSVPQIVFNEQKNTYEITKINRVVAVVNLDLTKTHSKATLIHEICHLIKSYNNEYVIDGNKLISASGLIESVHELSHDGAKVNKKLVKEVGVGLEEGLNSVAEEEITRNIVDAEFKPSGYITVNQIAKNLLSIENMKEIIVNAQIYHDKSEIYNKLGDNYFNLEEITDSVYVAYLDIFKNMFDTEKFEKSKDKLQDILRNEYLPLMNTMNNNLNRNS